MAGGLSPLRHPTAPGRGHAVNALHSSRPIKTPSALLRAVLFCPPVVLQPLPSTSVPPTVPLTVGRVASVCPFSPCPSSAAPSRLPGRAKGDLRFPRRQGSLRRPPPAASAMRTSLFSNVLPWLAEVAAHDMCPPPQGYPHVHANLPACLLGIACDACCKLALLHSSSARWQAGCCSVAVAFHSRKWMGVAAVCNPVAGQV